VRQPSIRRGPWPAVIGGGLVAVSVVAAGCVAALTGGPGNGAVSGAPAPSAVNRSVSAAASRGASLTGSSAPVTLNLPLPDGTNDPRKGGRGQPIPAARTSPSARTSPTAQTSAQGSTGSAGDAGSPSQQASAGPLSGQGAAPAKQKASAAAAPRLVVPDVIAAVPGGVTKADLARLRKLSHVRAVLPIAGARITVNGRQVTVLGAPAAALRPWTPPATAASQRVWADFAAGDLITTAATARSLQLVSGSKYPVAAAVRTRLTFGSAVPLGIAGVDAIVNQKRASQLGLAPNVAVLVNAPAADMITLTTQVRAALGVRSQVVRLVPVQVSTSLPVDNAPPKGRPASYLALFQESAARYCPGLSWTVLAAIGQIESGDGANVGPSSAGALGPMQFLPSTWRVWGIDGFGDTGVPDIMNPFDAVPSAARLLCADGAAAGGQSLRQAIFDYNHAGWYVDEVLTLAAEYAREAG
jgi:Transglycosylase SLT domain